MIKFKLGDRVIQTQKEPTNRNYLYGWHTNLKNFIGVVVCFDGSTLGVKFNEPIGGHPRGHTLGGFLKGDDLRKGRWYYPNEIELIEDEEYKELFI